MALPLMGPQREGPRRVRGEGGLSFYLGKKPLNADLGTPSQQLGTFLHIFKLLSLFFCLCYQDNTSTHFIG